MQAQPTSVIDDLAKYGPGSLQAPCSLEFARAYCRDLACRHYENFTVASWLLPRRLAPHFHAVYAWCRWADDLADETNSPAEGLTLLAWWRDLLLECYAGKASHPVLVALAETIREFGLPPQPFLDLLAAFERDQRQPTYETWADLLDYCRCSANPVGRLVLYLGRSHSAVNERLSDFVCTGLQLINFWQDIAPDFARGRIYLPRECQAEFGLHEADWRCQQATPAFRQSLASAVARAEDFLEAGLPLADLVAPEIGIEVELFARGGLCLVSAIRAQDYDVWTRRPRVGKLLKLRLLLAAAWRHGASMAYRNLFAAAGRGEAPHG